VALDEVLGQVTPEFISGLRRSDALGSEDFSAAVESFLFVREVAAAASTTDSRYLRPEALQSMESFLVEIRDTTAPEIEAFGWSDEGANTTRERITLRASEMRDYARDEVAPRIQYAEVDSAKAAADAAQIERSRQEADTILAKLRQVSGEAGASKLSGYYKTETERYAKQSVWLLWGIVGAVVLLGVLGYMFFFGPWEIEDTRSTSDDWQELAKDLTVRVFFLGIGAWVLAFLARTYRVTRHLETVNSQKQAALDTYPLFIEAVSSEQGRDMVTAELARSVLQGADSGFITADRERTVVESSPVSLLANRGSGLPPS